MLQPSFVLRRQQARIAGAPEAGRERGRVALDDGVFVNERDDLLEPAALRAGHPGEGRVELRLGGSEEVVAVEGEAEEERGVGVVGAGGLHPLRGP